MASAYDLNLRHLRALAAIADSGSVSHAARDCGMSQPALTQALAKLEVAFGLSLFTRTAAGVSPTTGGARVLHRVGRASAILARSLRSAANRTGKANPEAYLTMAHVRALVSFAEAGSFGRAAEVAGISVPAHHRALRDLEQLCGAALLEPLGRGLTLSRVGSKLARGFGLAIAELEAALEEGQPSERRLAIGAMALSRSLLLPAALAELTRQAPDVGIEVMEGSYFELVDFLRMGRIDVIVGALREHPPRDLQQEPLFENRLTIIGRAGHPLAAQTADLDDLARYPWIVARRASGLLERWQGMFDRASKPRPKAPIQCGSVALIRGLLVRSDFLTLLSPDQVEAELKGGSLIPIRSTLPDTMRTIGAISRRDWFPTPAQAQFMTILRAQCQIVAGGA